MPFLHPFRPCPLLWGALCLFCALVFPPDAFPQQEASRDIRVDGRLHFVRPNGAALTSIDIEIARTEAARARGLMGRHLRDFTQGMLFVYESPGVLRFWMRDTPGSLDMIFVTGEGVVLNVTERTTPLSDRIYTSAGRAQYVVEVRGGFARRFGIAPGVRVRWSTSPPLHSPSGSDSEKSPP